MIDRAIGIAGLALAIIFGVWSFAPEGWPKMPPWITLVGMGFGIFLLGLSLGLVISDYHTDKAKPGKPDLRLSLIGGNVFSPNAPDMVGKTGIALDAKIWNVGLPTVATDWMLAVIPEGREPVLGFHTKIPEILRLGGPINGAVVRGVDALDQKTKSNPIGATPIEGPILFYIPLDKRTVMGENTRIELTVIDSFGVATTTTKRMGDWPAR